MSIFILVTINMIWSLNEFGHVKDRERAIITIYHDFCNSVIILEQKM